ncbi:MAG: transposase [Acetobacteraceae bacterium]|nr:transposase [Acetobacteraceae bacterium]
MVERRAFGAAVDGIGLTDGQWRRPEPLLPPERGRPGRPSRGNGAMANAILWVHRPGSPWRDLPREYGPWRSARPRCDRRARAGVWQGRWSGPPSGATAGPPWSTARSRAPTRARRAQQALGCQGPRHCLGPAARAAGRARGCTRSSRRAAAPSRASSRPARPATTARPRRRSGAGRAARPSPAGATTRTASPSGPSAGARGRRFRPAPTGAPSRAPSTRRPTARATESSSSATGPSTSADPRHRLGCHALRSEAPPRTTARNYLAMVQGGRIRIWTKFEDTPGSDSGAYGIR